MLRYKSTVGLAGLILLLIMLYDLSSGLSLSSGIQRGLADLGLPMSNFVVSNLTYFITLTFGLLSYGIRKSRQRIQVDLQWYMKLLYSFKPIAHLPPPKMMEKGFPILIRNKSNNALIMTNIRVITIMGHPFFVPYSVVKAFLNHNGILSYTTNADEELDMPKRIEAKKTEIIYIPWSTIERISRELSEKVDFSKTVAMSFMRLYDEFAGQNWDTRTFHILTALFVARVRDFLERK